MTGTLWSAQWEGAAEHVVDHIERTMRRELCTSLVHCHLIPHASVAVDEFVRKGCDCRGELITLEPRLDAIICSGADFAEPFP